MILARTAVAATAAAALALSSPDSGSGDSSLVHEGSAAQRGRETVFTVTADQGHGSLTVESEAFVKKLTLREKRFRTGKDGELYTRVAGMVPCDIEPGTYPVELKEDDETVDTAELTVTSDMDPGNRDFCASHASYDDAVDRTSETAPDPDEDGGGGVGLGELAAVIAGTAVLSAVLASAATYLVTRRRRRSP
ncbi:hypothetical protein ACMATS_30395 [Streptoverticillium reticulum]|uniref:hypothetical protein n=1 Tax=Streptoverticillium reticulum TaxID=1433415 RepID=UPI0039BF7F58